MKFQYLIILVLFSLNLSAQYSDWKFFARPNSYGNFIKNGNFIWASSNVDIIKFDINTGVTTHFDKTNSPITDNWISAIAIDSSGNKWFGTWNKGWLYKYNDTTWTIYDTSNSPIPGLGIKKISIDSRNNIWFISSNATNGLVKFDRTNWTFYNTSNSGIPSNYITSIYCDDTIVWLGTNFALVKFDGLNWIKYDTTNSSISSNNSINSISKDNLGNIWLLHYNGVEKFDGNDFFYFDNNNTNIPNLNNNSMAIDQNNIIWTGCSTYNINPPVIGGIMSFDGISWTKYDTTNSPIKSVTVGSVLADENNNIWLSCANEGNIMKKSESIWITYNPFNAKIKSGSVKNIVFDKYMNPFIGTQDASSSVKRLVKFDWNIWTEFDYIHNDSWNIETDKFGNLYVKNQHELKKYNGLNWIDISNTPNIQNYYGYNMNLSCIKSDNFGGIWMDYFKGMVSYYDSSSYGWTYTYNEGLAYFNGTSWTKFDTLNTFIPNFRINDIKNDSSNNIWLATNIGLIKYDGFSFSLFNTFNSSIPFNIINSIAIDVDGNVWFSNKNYGFYKFDMLNIFNYQHQL